MALDFPSLPAVGQKYPQPPITGVPVYSWDGEKWTTYGGLLTPSGPADALPLMDATPAAVGTSTEYAREDHVHPTDTSRASDVSVTASLAGKVAKAGDTMTGHLSLPTGPAADNAVRKDYVDGATSSIAAVRYDAPQSLTSPQLIQARTNIYAAPFDALAYNGMQINGSMEVNQELAGVATNVTNKYVCDGWKHLFSGPAVLSSIADGGGGGIFPLFPNYRLLTIVTTAQTSLGSVDYAFITQKIEGFRVARLLLGTANAQPFTIGFWSAHHRTGVYSVAIRNNDANRSYVATYAHNVADVAQYNTITVPGDMTGTWYINNQTGIEISFTLAAGSSLTASSANTWLAGNYLAAPGQINAVAATSDIFRITGVTVHPGNEAPSFARSPLIMRPYDQELVTCKRYWERLSIFGGGYGIASGAIACFFGFSVEKRATPTATTLSTGTVINFSLQNYYPNPRGIIASGVPNATGVWQYDYIAAGDARL